MADWLEQYTEALARRDAREQAHKPYIDAFTRLADRAAQSDIAPSVQAHPTPASSQLGSSAKGKTKAGAKGDAEQASSDLLSQARADLANTQKVRAQLQAQVDDLTRKLAQSQVEGKSSALQIAELQKQKTTLERKVRDREEEIRGKQRLVVNAQDEAVALELQLNIAEERTLKAEKENKDLVERWMKRMGEEAERVNQESKW